MGHDQMLPIHLQRNVERARGHIGEIVGLDMGCLAGPYTAMVEHHLLMVAEHVMSITLPQNFDNFVAEAVLEYGVAGAQQLVDVAHPLEREAERVRVAVDI